MSNITAYAETVKPLGTARLVNGFRCDETNPAAVTEVVLPNGRVGYQVGPMGSIYASKAVALRHAADRREKAKQVKPVAAPVAVVVEVAPVIEVAPVVEYPAYLWASQITRRYASVATIEQTGLAMYLLCDDNLLGVTTEGVGPSLDDLEEQLMLNALAAAYDRENPVEMALEPAEMDELRMVAPIVTECDFARPARRRRVNAAKARRLAVA